MGVAPEALVGCSHRSIGSQNHVDYFLNIFPLEFLLNHDVSDDEDSLESNLLTISDLTRLIVGLCLALFPPRLNPSWWDHDGYRRVRDRGAVTPFSALVTVST